MEHRKLSIKMKGNDVNKAEIVDMVTGELIENIQGIHVMAKVDDNVVVTVEELQPEYELDLEGVDATVKKVPPASLTDKNGNRWISATWLAGELKKREVTANKGRFKRYMFTEDFLKELENPAQGAAKPKGVK